MSESVLCFPASLLREIGALYGFSAAKQYSEVIQTDSLRFIDREVAESSPEWKQLIPYIMLQCRDSLYSYVRGKGQGESRLHSLMSVGIGGHINKSDVVPGSSPFFCGMERELREEVSLSHAGEIKRCGVVGYINDDSTPVGRVHFGVAVLFTVENPTVLAKEKSIERCGFEKIDSLMEKDSLESWSRIVLNGFFAGRPDEKPPQVRVCGSCNQPKQDFPSPGSLCCVDCFREAFYK